MKKMIFFLFVQLMLINLLFSQSPLSILGKAGGQLLQDLSKKNEWKSIGKAIETAGDLTYEMEKINARNKLEITIKTNPDKIKRVYPAKGYIWKNPIASDDFDVVRIADKDIVRKNNAIDLLEKGQIYFEKGDWDKSLEYFSKSIEIESNIGSHIYRGILYITYGLYDKALEDFGIIFNYDVSDESFWLFYILKGVALSNKGTDVKAIDNFNSAIDLIGANSSNSELCTVLGLRSVSKRNLGKYNEAIDDLNKSIEICPNDFYSYSHRAIAKAGLGKYKDALNDCNISLSLIDEEDVIKKYLTLAQKSNLLFEMGNYKEAINYSNKVINLYDNNNMTSSLVNTIYYYTIYYRGASKIELGIIESGCSDIKKALDNEPSLSVDEYYNKYCK